jgi:hypothetical protein
MLGNAVAIRNPCVDLFLLERFDVGNKSFQKTKMSISRVKVIFINEDGFSFWVFLWLLIVF